MSFQNKYLKYKNKYLELKNIQYGGSKEEILSKNKTWWNTTSKSNQDINNLVTGRVAIDDYSFRMSSNPNGPDIIALKDSIETVIINFTSSEINSFDNPTDVINNLKIKFNAL